MSSPRFDRLRVRFPNSSPARVAPIPAVPANESRIPFTFNEPITTTAIAKRARVHRTTVVRRERRLGIVPTRFLGVRVYMPQQADGIIAAIAAKVPPSRSRSLTPGDRRDMPPITTGLHWTTLLADGTPFAVAPAYVETMIALFGDWGYRPLYRLEGFRWKGAGPGGEFMAIAHDGEIRFSAGAPASRATE